MPAFWTRTRRYLTAVWLGTAVLELGVLTLAKRTDNSWFLLLALALLLLPLFATDMTLRWVSRAPRKRWKRHDVEAALGTSAVGTPPVVDAPASGEWHAP
jgi:hypothetical protein